MIITNIFVCDKLRFVFGVFRHGARAPWNSLDQNNIDIFGSKWESQSQLTDVGLRQHYLLGYKNKEKYFSKLNISQTYNPNEIGIFSTDTERTIMSLYSELFGMFPPKSGPKLSDASKPFANPPIKNFNFTEKIDFLKDDVLAAGVNPFPVHLFDYNAKYFHLYDARICPGVKEYQDENKKSEKYLNYSNGIIDKYGEKIIKLENKTDISELRTFENMYSVFDTFMANWIDGRDLSKFTESGINLDEFKNLTIDFLTWDLFYISFGDKDSYVARVAFSPVFRYLFQLMDNRIEMDLKNQKDVYNSLNPKMLLYSAHDTTLSSMNVFLTYMFGKERVKSFYTYFASSFYFELYQNETAKILNDKDNFDEKYYLNVLFNEKNIFGGPISYAEFKMNIFNKLLSESEINVFCKFSEKNYQYIFIASSVILFILCIIFGILIYNKIQKVHSNENQVQKSYSKV